MSTLALGLIRDKPPGNWSDYYMAIRECDRIRRDDHPVFRSQKTATSGRNMLMSWMDTIEAGKEVIDVTTDWTQLSEENIAVLFGYKCQAKDWGLLGAMTRATRARRAFEENRDKVRQKIQESIASVSGAKNVGDFKQTAIVAIKKITK
jgi:hypothetical protein